ASIRFAGPRTHDALHSFPTRRSSDLVGDASMTLVLRPAQVARWIREPIERHTLLYLLASMLDVLFTYLLLYGDGQMVFTESNPRSEEHTSELQSQPKRGCRLLLGKNK